MPIPNTISDASTVLRLRGRLRLVRQRELEQLQAEQSGDDDTAHVLGRAIDQLADGILADLQRLDLDGHLARLERLLSADVVRLIPVPDSLGNMAAGQRNG